MMAKQQTVGHLETGRRTEHVLAFSLEHILAHLQQKFSVQ